MRPIFTIMPLLALVLVASTPSHTSACSCTNEPDFARAYAESDAIFLGEVLGVESAAPEYAEAVWATIAVEADWKGSPPATVRVLTGANGAICGYTFEPGVRYLVYAFSGENGAWGGPPLAPGEVTTHLCWRTHPYWADDPDLVALGPTPVAVGSWGSVKIRYR